jgi:hypothetical protein
LFRTGLHDVFAWNQYHFASCDLLQLKVKDIKGKKNVRMKEGKTYNKNPGLQAAK